MIEVKITEKYWTHTLHLRAQRRVQFGKKKAQLGGRGTLHRIQDDKRG